VRGPVLPATVPSECLQSSYPSQGARARRKHAVCTAVAVSANERSWRHFSGMEGVHAGEPNHRFAGVFQAQHRTRTDDPFLTRVKSGVAADRSAAERKWANPSPGAGLRALREGRPPDHASARFGAGVPSEYPRDDGSKPLAQVTSAALSQAGLVCALDDVLCAMRAWTLPIRRGWRPSRRWAPVPPVPAFPSLGTAGTGLASGSSPSQTAMGSRKG
jgi:hypothetical protein